MVIADDDVGVIPVSVTAFTHVPRPPTMRTVRPCLPYISNAKLVRSRDNLQRSSLLPGPKLRLMNCHIQKRTRSDIRVVIIIRSPAKMQILVECLDQRSVAGRVSECSGNAFVAIQGDGDANE